MARIHIVVNKRPMDTDLNRTDTWARGEPLHVKRGNYDGPVGAHTKTVQFVLNVTGVPDEIPFRRLKRIFEHPHETDEPTQVVRHALRRHVLDMSELRAGENAQIAQDGRLTVTWARCLNLFDIRNPGLRTRFRKMRRRDFNTDPPGD